jgi:hypothetical protein
MLSRNRKNTVMSQPAAADDLTLNIGKLSVLLRLDNPGLETLLRRRYWDFLGVPKGRPLVCNITFEPVDRPLTKPEGALRFSAGGAFFEHPDYQGTINVESGSAHLALRAVEPISGVETFLRIAFMLLAYQAGGMLFHGAGIRSEGKGYLFFGPSGSGKTTIARLSSPRTVLNDDLVLLLPTREGWVIQGTPFTNPSQVRPKPASAPLTCAFRLQKSTENRLEILTGGVGLAEIFACIPVLPRDSSRSKVLMGRSQDMLQSTRLYRLSFQKNATFWPLIAEITPDSARW